MGFSTRFLHCDWVFPFIGSNFPFIRSGFLPSLWFSTFFYSFLCVMLGLRLSAFFYSLGWGIYTTLPDQVEAMSSGSHCLVHMEALPICTYVAIWALGHEVTWWQCLKLCVRIIIKGFSFFRDVIVLISIQDVIVEAVAKHDWACKKIAWLKLITKGILAIFGPTSEICWFQV